MAASEGVSGRPGRPRLGADHSISQSSQTSSDPRRRSAALMLDKVVVRSRAGIGWLTPARICGPSPSTGPCHESCATSVAAPCARGIFGAGRGALSGADLCPASAAAVPAAGPSWCSQVGSGSRPRAQRRVVAPWASRSRLATVVPCCSLPSVAATFSRPRRLAPPRPEPGGRRLGPSGPRRSAPSCWPAPPAPASAACVSARSPATCLAWPRRGHAA